MCRSSRFGWDVIFVHTNMLPVGFKPRDDELDPMDPAAYSDTPRYSLNLNDGRCHLSVVSQNYYSNFLAVLYCSTGVVDLQRG